MATTETAVLSGPGPARTLAERATTELRADILSGRLAPGTPLRLEELARSLAMSVMPVREAVRRLESMGLAEHVPHRGARVSAISLEDLRDTYELRLQLEPLAVGHAAARFTAAEAAYVRARLREQIEASRRGDVDGARAAHAAFHFGLYTASGSGWLPRVIQPLWDNSERYRATSLPARGSVGRRRREHQRILDACVRHDGEAAARELRAHLALTANLVAREMGGAELFSEDGSVLLQR